MSECTNIELRSARDAANLSREELGRRIGVSDSTIQRWEEAKSKPHPDDVLAIAKATGAGVDLWWAWMRSNYASFREVLPPKPLVNGILASVVNAKHQISDMLPLLEHAERDSIDGVIDNHPHAARTAREARDAAAALLDLAERMEKEGG